MAEVWVFGGDGKASLSIEEEGKMREASEGSL